jgi:hypothetical protein
MSDNRRLAVALANLQPTDWKAFEDFASVFLTDEYPDLRVLAGSGDKGRDAIFQSESSGVVAQYSVTPEWRSKIRETIERLGAEKIRFTVLIYATNRAIAVLADELKVELRRGGVELDPRDPASYFLPRIDRSTATRRAAQELSRRVVDDMLPTTDAVQSSPLSTFEMKAGLLYLELQLADAGADRNLTKLTYEAVVLGVLADVGPKRRLTRNEIVANVQTRFPGHEPVRIKELVSGALGRLQTKVRVTYQKSTDSFALHAAERAQLVYRAAELAAERLSLRSEIALIVAAREKALDLSLRAADSDHFIDVIEEVVESLLEHQGTEFVSAIESRVPSVSRVDLYDLAKAAIYPKAKALKEALRIDEPVVQDLVELATDSVGELISRPGETMQAHLRQLADAYTLLAFIQQTPDVQKAVAQLFSRGTLVLDTTVILPVFVETARPIEEQRYTNLLRAARSAGLDLVVTHGVLNEIETHLERGLACERRGDTWIGPRPFVYRQWIEFWPDRQSYSSFVDSFMGKSNPEGDLQDFLSTHIGIKTEDLGDKSRTFDVSVVGVVSEIFRERKQRYAIADPDGMGVDIRVLHDVEMFLGVLAMRHDEEPSVFGYEAWLVTSDGASFRMRDLAADRGVKFASSPAMHPNFLSNLLALGPSRTAMEPSVKRLLPVALDLEAHGWGVPGLSAIAESIRSDHQAEPEWKIRRKLREAMERVKAGRGAFDDGTLTDLQFIELTKSGPLEIEV